MSSGRKLKINKRLDLSRLPKHVAIIMDGNGRWATKRGLPRKMGHRAGFENIKRVVQDIYDLGIPCVTFFTFSTENWKRPQDEIDSIFAIVSEHLNDDLSEYIKMGVKVTTMGDITKLPKDLYDGLVNAMEKTKDGDKFILNLAINYGSRNEILRAVNLSIEAGKPLESLEEFNKLLYTKDLCDPDFVIRTSGELRLSNFMMYQIAYSELYFTPTYWPDFNRKELQKALIDFQKRKRRFGGLKSD